MIDRCHYVLCMGSKIKCLAASEYKCILPNVKACDQKQTSTNFGAKLFRLTKADQHGCWSAPS